MSAAVNINGAAPEIHRQCGGRGCLISSIKGFEAEHYLLRAEILWDRVPDRAAHPFSLAAVQRLTSLEFHPKVTFIVGENGSGKSTLIEAIAIAWGFNPEGGSRHFNFATHASHSRLHEVLRLARSSRHRARDGFFLRAESYFNVATRIEQMDQEPSLDRKVIEAY